jgi:hypothetical protein
MRGFHPRLGRERISASSGVGFFFLSLFLSPLIGFIFAAILHNKDAPQKEIDHRWANLRSTAPQPRQESNRPRVDTASCF